MEARQSNTHRPDLLLTRMKTAVLVISLSLLQIAIWGHAYPLHCRTAIEPTDNELNDQLDRKRHGSDLPSISWTELGHSIMLDTFTDCLLPLEERQQVSRTGAQALCRWYTVTSRNNITSVNSKITHPRMLTVRRQCRGDTKCLATVGDEKVNGTCKLVSDWETILIRQGTCSPDGAGGYRWEYVAYQLESISSCYCNLKELAVMTKTS